MDFFNLKNFWKLDFNKIDNKIEKIEIIENIIVKRTSKRLKTVSLKVKNGEVEILCPSFTSDSFLRDLIHKKRGWIKKNLSRSTKNPQNIDQISNGYLNYKGFQLKLIYEKANYQKIVLANKELKIFYDQNKTKNIRKLIVDWLKSESKRFLINRLLFLSKKIDIKFHSLNVKSYKARWGSCNERGEIFLNWKLIMLPKRVIDYVLIHELVHIIVPNHSKEFWNLVEEKDPDFREKRKWLKYNGSYLISFS